MQFNFDRSILSSLQAALEVAGKTIMANACLVLEGNKLSIATSDGQMFFNTSATVDGKLDGSCLVSASKLCEVIGSLKSESIEFKLENGKAVLKQGRSRLTIKSLDILNFPASPDMLPVSMFSITSDVIQDINSKVAYSVATDSTRYFMTGTYFKVEGKKLIAVATDSRRLALNSYQIEAPDGNGIIMPSRILSMMARRAKSEILLSFDGKYIKAEFDGSIIVSLVIDGQFPNYKKVIPESQQYKIELNRKDMLDALGRVGLFTDMKSRRMFLEVAESTMILSSDECDEGSAKEEIAIVHNGNATKIGVNSQYMVDILKSSVSETITIEYTAANRALTIRDGTDGYLAVVMPMTGAE